MGSASDSEDERREIVTNQNILSPNAKTSSTVWDETKTDAMERDLQQQIKKLEYVNSGDHDQQSIIEQEDVDSDDGTESDVSSLAGNDDQNGLDINDDDANEKPSNLFRAQSRRNWKTDDLDEQESALKEHMRLLSGDD